MGGQIRMLLLLAMGKYFTSSESIFAGTDLFYKKSLIFALPQAGIGHSFRAPTVQPVFTMSKHNSLKSNTTVGGKRSVRKRFERVKVLKERGHWKPGASPIGLPKTKAED